MRQCGVQRRPHGTLQAPAKPPGGSGKGAVGHGGKAGLVTAQGKQEVGDAIARGQLGVGHAHAVAVHQAPARSYEQRPGLAHQPDAELAALEHQTGGRVALPRPMSDQVAQQSQRRPLGALARPPARTHDVGPAARIELGDDPCVGEGAQRDRRDSGCRVTSTAATSTKGTTWASVVSVHSRSALRNAEGSTRGRQGTEASSGSSPLSPSAVDDWLATVLGAARAQPPAMGRRMITRSASAGSSRTCSAWRSPVETMAK